MHITQTVVEQRDRALLGGDYATYHAQTCRRLHALRKRLGVATPRGRKYVPKSTVTADNVAQNVEWVQLLLTSSERAWASAMAMKAAQSPDNTQRPMAGSTKKQIISRFRRSLSYASNLVEILSNSVSKSSQVDTLEAKAYLALLQGGLEFEKSNWTSCIQYYAICRVIYATLDMQTKTELYSDLLSSTVDPSIKYAAYQSKLPRTKAVSDIAIGAFPSAQTTTRTEIQQLDSQAFMNSSDKAASAQNDTPSNLPTSITWRSRAVQIEDGSVSQALGFSLDSESKLAERYAAFNKGEIGVKDLAAAYEEAIDARQEAVGVIKTAIDELKFQGVDQGDTRIQSLQITRTAVNYAVIEWRVGRNRILCGKDDGLLFDMSTQKNGAYTKDHSPNRKIRGEPPGKKLARLRECIALYDSILQSLDAVKELPGVAADNELVQEVDSKSKYFRALKCLAIGRSHSLNANSKNALALFSHASNLVNEGHIESFTNSSEGPTKLNVSPSRLTAVRSHLASLTMQYRAFTELKELDSSVMAQEEDMTPPFIERLHLGQYDTNVDAKHLVNYPPKLQPIPVKPLFFDLAWNYIQYQDQNKQQDQTFAEKIVPAKKGEEQDKPAKKGWFGFGR